MQSKAAPRPGEPAPRLPGVEGVWVFVAADMVMFALLFASFMQARGQNPDVFEASRRTLDPDFGGLNTLILLTSSFLVAQGAEAARLDRPERVARFLALAAALGIAFGISKAFEYGAKLRAGISPLTNDFYMYYFTLTGVHLVHVLAGVVVLAVLWSKARTGAYTASNRRGLETGATYWHMVDLLWIVLFPAAVPGALSVQVLRSPIGVVWLLLMAATVLTTWGLSKDAWPAMLATPAIVVIAAVKVRLVLLWFMELRTAPRPWRILFEAWVLVTTGLILGFWYGASA